MPTYTSASANVEDALSTFRLDIGCNRGVLTVTQIEMGAGLCPLLVCCPKNCPLCANRANCLKNAKNPSCCPDKDIAATLQRVDTGLSDIEVSCRYKAPPCTMPPADDPCVGQHGDRVVCLRNARCGVRYVSDDPGYVQGTTTSTDNGCIGTGFYCLKARQLQPTTAALAPSSTANAPRTSRGVAARGSARRDRRRAATSLTHTAPKTSCRTTCAARATRSARG
eukprot:TRINITY_DN306_c1_g2_i6.p1 TRINITY_DN306_c1_g2~~TRINITY_DN306_c1_g2_i6.p1  ORF type:complete len:224 (-),score=38.44 TRINITY_DN306_c1_g2_i6:376-1047(-)